MQDRMALIFEMYKHLYESMAKKDVKIMALKIEHKCMLRKLCKTNPSKTFTGIGLAKKMKEFIIDCEFYF